MKRLYEKNELTFSLMWIGLYVVLFSAADNLSRDLGTEKVITAPLCLIFVLILAGWIKKSGLCEKYGLQKVKVDYRRYLYFLPLILIASINLWGGLTLKLSVGETILYVVSMMCVGFIEEVIFRGFLFKALCRENLKQAMIISSLTFGIGHIVNLLNGAQMFETLLQICYAVAIGFLFTVIFHRSRSLVPCIITHSAINSLSTFAAGERSTAFYIIAAAILTVVSLTYAAWILKTPAPSALPDGSKARW